MMKMLMVFLMVFSFFSCSTESSKTDGDSENDSENNDMNAVDNELDDADSEVSLEELASNVEITWKQCSLYEGEMDGKAECAYGEMPYRWLKPDGRIFKTYAKKYSSGQPIKRQLWLLHGGPGASGVKDFGSWMERLVKDNPDLEVLTIDPRGVGYSHHLECPKADFSTVVTDEQFQECADWLDEEYGEDKIVFGATHAAIDAAAFIMNSRREGAKVFVWGGSGGTFWTQRMLYFFPDIVDGVIIEGIVPPAESMVHQDKYTEEIGRKILEMCKEDEFCSSKIPEPEQFYKDLKVKLSEGHCSMLGITAEYLGSWMYNMLFYFPTHDMIPGFLYRLDRCETGDVNAIFSFYNKFFGNSVTSDKEAFSMMLFYNELFGECWLNEDFPTADDIETYLDDIYDDAWIATGFGYDRNKQYKMWTPYKDENAGLWAETDVPMLMLQGKLDPSTPYDYAVLLKDHFNGEYQHFVEFPYAPHNVASGTPTEKDTESIHCGQAIWNAFMEDPKAELDLSCVSKTLPPDFKGEGAYAEYYFETKNYWDNEAPETVRNIKMKSFFIPPNRMPVLKK